MSSEQPRRMRESGGSASSPIGSTAAIVIAVLSVIGGFLILREIHNSGGTSSPASPGGITPTVPHTASSAVTNTTVGPSVVSTSAAPTSTVPKVTAGATVIVVNASITSGAAGVLTTALKGKGFTTAKATNIDTATAKYDATKVFYDSSNAAALPVANYLSFILGGAPVEKMPSPVPVSGGKLPTGVTVVLMLGNDKANKTLDQMGGATGDTTVATTAAGATTVAGASTTVKKTTGATTTTVKKTAATTTSKKP